MIDEKVLLQSRPEALNDKMDMDLQNQKGGYNNGWNDCLFMFIDRIKKQPKVGEWIPVTERLMVELGYMTERLLIESEKKKETK